MIYRFQYTAYLKSGLDITNILPKIKNEGKISSENGLCMTVSLFRYENELYLYFETTDENMLPEKILPSMNEWVQNGWTLMENVYYTAIPADADYWARQGEKKHIGRLGRLVSNKINSYIHYHKEIMKEGLFDGDKYLFISLTGNTLFLYSESPDIMTHLRSNSAEKSKVIEEWRSINPGSHFDHDFSGDANFVYMEDILSQ